MDVEIWRDGVKRYYHNAIQLRNSGMLLMNNGAYGHAYFFFYTAMEELGVAYIILQNFDKPIPKELHKFLKSKNSHRKKSMLNVFDFFKSELKNLNLPKDYLKEFW